MSKITKVLMMVVMVGSLVLMSTGCGGSSSDDNSYADVAGGWEVITYDDPVDTYSVTIYQDGNVLSVVDDEGEALAGGVDGNSIYFEYSEVQEGELLTMRFNLTANNTDFPTEMTGFMQGILENEVIVSYPTTWTRQ